MDDLETAEAYRREAEFYKEKAEENIRYKCLYLRLGGEMYESWRSLRRTPCRLRPASGGGEPSPPDAGTGG